MPNPSAAFTSPSAVQRTADDIVARRPALEGLVRPFAILYARKAQCAAQIRGAFTFETPAGARDRLASGIPALVSTPLASWHEALAEACSCMLPAVGEAFPAVGDAVDVMSAASAEGRLPLVDLAEDGLTGGFGRHEAEAHALGVAPDALAFVMQAVLSTCLTAFETSLGEEADGLSWFKGTCPLCGSLPSLSVLDKPSPDTSEFLKETGGRRYLHCSLCGHDWRVGRHACPVCDQTGLRKYLTVTGEPGERVDVCDGCKAYLPCLDLRERDPEPHLDMAAVGMAHLDILARQKGYRPVVDLPWNRAEN